LLRCKKEPKIGLKKRTQKLRMKIVWEINTSSKKLLSSTIRNVQRKR
jgi:hypothetical protein